MSITRILCEGGCGFPIAWCECKKPESSATSGGSIADWQPMDVAPKDGTEILLFAMGDIGVCYWRDDNIMTGWTWGLEKRFNNPSHWMPLPKAPSN